MSRRAGCLIIHGFGGTVEEIIPLAHKLQEEGYEVICPVLKGHGGKRQDLKGISYKDWLKSAEEGFKDLKAKCSTVYLVGFSMGGLIAINLALKYEVGGVVTLNSPIYYWDIKRIVLNILDDVKRRKTDNIKFYLRSGSSFPVSALLNFRLLLEITKPKIREMRCPVFIVQALEDDTVRKSSAEYIYKSAASDRKAIKYYENSGHLILWSEAAVQVMEDVRDFLRSLGLHS